MRWLLAVRQKWHVWLHDHSGVAAVFTAITIAVLLGFAALVIDVGHIMVARGELQNAADSAALAGARGYFPVSPSLGPLTPDIAAAKAAALDYVTKNYADTHALTIDSDNDIKTGVWNWGSPGSFEERTDFSGFMPSSSTVLAVQVTVRKDSVSNPSVAMTLAAFFGVTEVNTRAHAVAVNALPLASNQKCDTFIFAVPECLANAACGATNQKFSVKFSNDTDDTAGWASFVSPVNANDQKCLALSVGASCGTSLPGGCNEESYCQPPEEVTDCSAGGTPVYVQNGVDASVIMALKDSLEACGSLTLRVPVVQGGAGEDCTGVKWTGTKCLIGYAEFIIDPNDPDIPGHVNPTANPDKWYPPNNSGLTNEIQGYVRCIGDSGQGKPGEAGSDYYGTVSLVPKLAQ